MEVGGLGPVDSNGELDPVELDGLNEEGLVGIETSGPGGLIPGSQLPWTG